MTKRVNKTSKLSKTKGKTAKIGRPFALEATEQTLDTLRGLGRIQATSKETAAVLNVSEPTLFAFFKREEKARELWERGQQEGRVSLRRQQFAMAQTSATMQIWLGKQYLGQKDHSESSVHVKGDHTITHVEKPVSETLDWVESVLGRGQEGALSKSLPN